MTLKMQVILQSGGKGTRLGVLAKNKPKCFLNLKGKPIFHYQYENLKKFNLHKNLSIIVNKNHYIYFKEFFKRKKYKAKIIKETPGLGSGGSLIKNYEILENKFILIYCDIFFNVNFTKFLKKFKNQNKIFTHISSHRKDSDLIEINEDNSIFRIIKKNENKAVLSKTSISGIYFLNKKIFNLRKLNKNLDLTNLIINNLNKYKFYSYFSNEIFSDFGTLERYKELKKNYNKKYKKVALIFDRDGTIISEKKYVNSKKKIILFNDFLKFLTHLKQKNIILICITNQPGIAKGFLKMDNLNKIHKYLNFLINKKTKHFFDKFYFCPHYPISGFKNEVKKYKINCKCRKPKAGMFKKAIEDFDLLNCKVYNIGNSIVDIKAGKKAGLKNNFLLSNNNQVLKKKFFYYETNYRNLTNLIL